MTEYRLKKLPYQHDTCWARVFISVSPRFNHLSQSLLKLLRISSPTLGKMQLQLNIYSWRASSWGRQRDLLSGSSGFHRGGWRLRATSSAEIFARALINYSINPPGILLARCPGRVVAPFTILPFNKRWSIIWVIRFVEGDGDYSNN